MSISKQALIEEAKAIYFAWNWDMLEVQMESGYDRGAFRDLVNMYLKLVDQLDTSDKELQRLQSPHRALVTIVEGHEALTARQREALSYIIKYYDRHGYSPSIREVQEALNLQSASTAQGIVKRIEEKGYIKRNGKKGLTITGLRERVAE